MTKNKLQPTVLYHIPNSDLTTQLGKHLNSTDQGYEISALNTHYSSSVLSSI